jgi:hypothetical protein
MSGEELSSVQFITKAVFNPASLTGSYQPLNGSGFSDDVKIFEMFNGSLTVSIDISYDGVNNHDFIGPNQAKIRDFQANHSDINGSGTKYGRKGQIVWGKTAESPTFLQLIGSR